MDDNIVNAITELYKENKWKEIVEKYHYHPDRNKLLWVYPSEGNFLFLRQCLNDLGTEEVVSIGCGSGLLEWMINQATGFPVSGVEVDGAWWRCKYAPPTFIKLTFISPKLNESTLSGLRKPKTALLFCYFNNRNAFEDYLRYFLGNVLVIIGPDGKGVHTDPGPFDQMPDHWHLYKFQEVRHSRDFIAVYHKKVKL